VSGAKAIQQYAELCVLTDTEPNEAEFIALAYFGVIPKWIQEILA